ncbi:MAG: DUF1499 domain-containing protein [Gammaproteobacteria bacterium]|nr:DUF1499 domain-containing protein [Gammaproteobacteria bacterium]
MKVIYLILIILTGIFATIFFMLAYLSKSGVAPGLTNGRLAKCPYTPNCVCSEYPNNSRHYVTPLLFLQDNNSVHYVIIKAVIKEMGGHIVHENDNYLAAIFSSSVFGFVDDVEIRFDPANRIIHMRSASRVGYSDAGVNTKRLQSLKVAYNSKIAGLNSPYERNLSVE